MWSIHDCEKGEVLQLNQEDGYNESDYVPALDYTGRHSEILLKTATPQLYRENAFRILGLPVNVTLRGIERHQQKLEMAKLGKFSLDQNHSYLPLDSPPDEDSIKHAMERLRDPEKRLIEGFFWFWPTKSDSHNSEAFGLLSENRVKDTIDFWKKTVESGSCSITAHNLAVLYHTHALDMEHKSVKQLLTKEELEICGLCWKGAFREWQRLLDNETFWSQVTARIRDINDPRLTEEIAKHIRYSLPKALFRINAHLAKLAAERNDEPVCNYHIALVNQFGFDNNLFITILHETVNSIRNRIQIICSSFTTNTDKNPEHTDIRIWEFLLEAKPLLKTIDLLLPKDDLGQKIAHDEIARIARDRTITYINKTDDWEEGRKLLLQVFDFAVDVSLRYRLREDIKIANKYAEQEQKSTAFKLAEAEKKKSLSYTTKSIKMKCLLAKENAENNPGNADKVIWQLLTETKPLLQTLKKLISDDEQLINRAKDEIAETSILCQIVYGNRTKNWQQCVALLMPVHKLAFSGSLRGRIKESINRLNECLRQKQEHEDLKHIEGKFLVSVSSTNVTIPSVCSCCLTKAETTYKISGSCGEGQDKITREFNFPSCRICRQHQKELRWKRVVFVFLVTVLPIAVSYLIGFDRDEFSYLEFIKLGGMIFIAIFSIMAALMRTKKLSKKHISRSPAVLLEEVRPNFSIFGFWNPSYAHAFAQANGSQVKKIKVSKRLRNLHFVRGGAVFRRMGWIIVIVLVGLSVVYCVLYVRQWKIPF